MTSSDAEIAGCLSRIDGELDSVLRPLIPPGARCALLDAPDYANVGDSAIWLGEKAYLRRIGASVVYACDAAGYSEAQLARHLGDGVILLSGGGNLGDLWPVHQRLRERVIGAFPGHRIVQLPQSIWFEDEAHRERARAVFDAHPRLTLLVRDRRSLELARRAFKTPSLLCPDMAHALGARPRKQPARQEVLWLLRDDLEARDPASPRAVESVDWRSEPDSWVRRLERFLTEDWSWRLPARRWTGPLLAVHDRVRDGLARQRLERGCALLARGEVVVTDRLHGHLLSLLLGIPHVLLDNSYGKVRSYHETWTRTCGLARWARSTEEASVLAADLVRATRAPASAAMST